jgi:hypothetical protein
LSWGHDEKTLSTQIFCCRTIIESSWVIGYFILSFLLLLLWYKSNHIQKV